MSDATIGGAALAGSQTSRLGGLGTPVGVGALLVVLLSDGVGLGSSVPAGVTAISGVGMVLVVAWALAGLVGVARPQTRAPGRLVSLAAVAAAVTLAAQRVGAQHASGGAREVATFGAAIVVATSFHVLTALPGGRLENRARRVAVGAGYGVAVVAGAVVTASGGTLPAAVVAVGWSVAVAVALPALRGRYLASVGADRDRLQWAGIGVVVAADVALVVVVLHALVRWPAPIGAVTAAATAAIPIASTAGHWRRVAPRGGRIVVQLLSIVGFTVVVSAIYVIVVLGLGHAPSDGADRQALGLSMLAAAVAAVGYLPARDRLLRSATRFVYGARQAPDEVLRTFGSRLTRAVPMEELLLQLAESLRKTMSLASTEVYTGAGDVLELAVSVPDAARRPVVLSGQERSVVARAGVSGTAWASVWLPTLVEGRRESQLRVAPASHGGELMGLIVAERASAAEPFSEADDRVLTELAREVGLAFHNVHLDAALQTTLEELRKQAEDLRESRARIVASGDAERRRVERNLHDGAQQRLVALAVNLRLARDVVADEPAAGTEMLDQLVVEVQETIQELRELAHGIYPPLLIDGGLGPALRAAGSRSPVIVDVVTPDLERYPPEIEAAIYFCCMEALQNAAKHAPSAHVVVTVKNEAGGLVFSVTDDGPGCDADVARRGHGFVNMADRVGAIGGTVRWESEGGRGVRVYGSVPLL